MVKTRSKDSKKDENTAIEEETKVEKKTTKAKKTKSEGLKKNAEVEDTEESKIEDASKKIKKQPKEKKAPKKEAAKQPAKEPKAKPKKTGCGGCPFYTPEEQKLFEEKVEELSKLSFVEIKNVISKYGQPTGGKQTDLTDRAADIMVRGEIERCPRCTYGTLKFDVKSGTYYCPGYAEDHWYVTCKTEYQYDEIERTPFDKPAKTDKVDDKVDSTDKPDKSDLTVNN